MTNGLNEVKFQTSNICNAMLRNINENFFNISFNIEGGEVLVKIILEEKTKAEEIYIDDLIAELTASQSSNCVKKPIIEVGNNNQPLDNIVYQREEIISKICF